MGRGNAQEGHRAHRNDARLGRPAFDAQASAPQRGDSNRGLEADTSEMPYDLSEGGVQHTNSKGPATAKGRREPALTDIFQTNFILDGTT